MQGSRPERAAKAQGLGILVLMAVVAVTVLYWPRSTPERVRSADVALAAPAAAGRVPAYPPRSPRPGSRALRRVSPAVASPLVPTPPPTGRPGGHVVTTDTLAALPGSPVALPAGQIAASPNRRGAVTRAAQSTGKGLTGAFRKTGAAFRRAF